MRRRPFRLFWLRCGKPGKRAPGQLLFSILLGLAVAGFLIHQINSALRPQLVALAQAKLRNQLTQIANRSVTDALARQALTYSDMVIPQAGQEDGISIVSTDTVRLNLLRTAVLEDIVSQAESLDSHCLGVPLGALTGLDLLSGSGPSLPVQILSVSSADGAYRNDFISAGINQTLHRVMLDVTITAEVLLPGGVVETTVSTPVCVVETIIIGKVPQAYLNWSP